ncbi:MAG TPA: formate dehydrogenase accessory sulfurtransferase FdhD [Xanthomonadales bacterium]|nr:formate dehydrogenase accessory sulfurtransferase FdhD [Xanthomonadales bacterium]
MATSRVVTVRNWQQNRITAADDHIAAEVPVALTYNRLSHVVMMATPADLEDFALGFSLTEGIIGSKDDLLATRVLPREGGMEVAMSITEPWFDRLATQRRNLTGRTGCGLCGAERIEQALRYPAPVGDNVRISHAALQSALREMQTHQPLQAATGATHGAAWCDLQGAVVELREDVGRHNALDKLIGALARKGFDPRQGFILVSSRASYEMVFKAAVAGVEVLLAVSAPTTLAIEFAERCGVTLVGFARPGRHNIYTFGQRIIEETARPA